MKLIDKAAERALERFPVHKGASKEWIESHLNGICSDYIEGYHQAEKDVAEAFARIIRGNLSGIRNGIQNMFEQLYTDITGEKMYKGFND
jgi:hypothetical protein